MSDISLLPEELRKKEEALKKSIPPQAPIQTSELKFSSPLEDGEDVEVIEIDEGEIAQVLAGEPFITKLVFRITNFFQDLTRTLFHPNSAEEPAPKRPPQFFKPPAGKVSEELAQTKVRIVPSEKVPKRVRVMKRVRKPVRVSFVSEEQLELLRIDIPKRRFTFIALVLFFAVLLAGGAIALSHVQRAVSAELAAANAQFMDVRSDITTKQKAWASFQDLEPKLRALLSLLDTHISPTRLLEQIERTTLPTVHYELFSLTPDRTVSLGVVTNSFESAAAQIVAFERSGFVTKVDATGYTAKYEQEGVAVPSSVQFQMTLTLSDAAMAEKVQKVAGLK
ncbi:MAG: hypothetical protein AAB879_03035 [Patescibacteria group bacterium]